MKDEIDLRNIDEFDEELPITPSSFLIKSSNPVGAMGEAAPTTSLLATILVAECLRLSSISISLTDSSPLSMLVLKTNTITWTIHMSYI